MQVPFTKTTLENGLNVIVHEDRRVPLVAVNVWYHVGSKQEVPGRTGLAHLFEHLMFEGSAHQPHGYFEPLQRAGAAVNGSTSPDRTNYWETVPTEATRLALWMEADRMGWMLPALTLARFETQRGVVLNERRQSYENRPYGLAQFALLRALFPPDHPYHWPTIGQIQDLRDATLEDARAFFERFYHPANASLVIAGDVETKAALALAAELFGEIPAGPDVRPVTPPPLTRSAHRLVMEDRVELPRLYLAWHSPALCALGDAELDLASDVLANGRNSRLYRRLLYDERVASDVTAAQTSRELNGTFQIVVTAAPGRSLDEVHVAISEEVQRLGAGGPDADELERGRAQAEAAFVYRLQALGGFGGKADQLNAYNTYLGQPDSFDADLARYLVATGELGGAQHRQVVLRHEVPERPHQFRHRDFRAGRHRPMARRIELQEPPRARRVPDRESRRDAVALGGRDRPRAWNGTAGGVRSRRDVRGRQRPPAGAVGEPARIGHLVDRVQVLRAHTQRRIAQLAEQVEQQIGDQIDLPGRDLRGVLRIGHAPQRVVNEELGGRALGGDGEPSGQDRCARADDAEPESGAHV